MPVRGWIDDLPDARIETGATKKQAEISRFAHHPETVQIKTMKRYVRSLGGVFKIVAELPDGTSAEIPLHGGKPVNSKLTVERKKKQTDAEALIWSVDGLVPTSGAIVAKRAA